MQGATWSLFFCFCGVLVAYFGNFRINNYGAKTENDPGIAYL